MFAFPWNSRGCLIWIFRSAKHLLLVLIMNTWQWYEKYANRIRHLYRMHSWPISNNLCAVVGCDGRAEVQGISMKEKSVCHYNDVIMNAMASQVTSFRVVYSTVHSDADQRKHQSFASLAFVRGIHRWPVDSPHERPSNAENVSIWWRYHVCLVYYKTDVSSSIIAISEENNLRILILQIFPRVLHFGCMCPEITYRGYGVVTNMQVNW